MGTGKLSGELEKMSVEGRGEKSKGEKGRGGQGTRGVVYD